MADSTLTNLTATTTLASGDLLYVVDGGNSRKIDWADVVSNFSQSSTEDITLSAPSGTIPGSPVQVVPFDTAQDDDGGAWRHRCAGLSWMEEDLATGDYLGVYANAAAAYSADGSSSVNWYWNSTGNTLEQLDGDGTNDTTIYRGSTQKFPARGFIVVYADDVFICEEDGTPWMVFNGDAGALKGSSTISSLSMLNGLLYITHNNGAARYRFLDESLRRDFVASASTNVGNFSGYGIADRNTDLSGTGSGVSSGEDLVNGAVNDVATTTLPDAPIDQATGLPKPTIPVATDGGLSAITHDGDVFDSASTAAANAVICTDQGVWWSATSGADLFFATWADVYAGDGFGDQVADTTAGSSDFDLLTASSYMAAGPAPVVGGASGLMLHAPNYADQTKGMSALITSDYNTGWMPGDIKGAFLCDTDDTNVTASDVVSTGDFSADTNWTKGTGWTIGSGTASSDGTQSGDSDLEQALTTVSGEKYVAQFTLSGYSAGNVSLVIDSTEVIADQAADGSFSGTFTTTSTSHTIKIRADVDFVGDIDDVSFSLAEPDRSVNNNGLIVNGTITKTAVATGAEDVAYSGFSASNYLSAPSNSAWDTVGTGAFGVMLWFKNSGNTTTERLFDISNSGQTVRFFVSMLADGKIRAMDDGATAAAFIDTTSAYDNSTWNHVAFFRSSSTERSLYINGELFSTNTDDAGSLTDTGNLPLSVGALADGSSPATNMDLSRVRPGAGAPTAEQIKQIYEDEKHLYQENADSTLYGSSDAVLGVSYDPTRDEYSAPTTGGRSTFRKLNRVSEDAAVTTAYARLGDLEYKE